MAITGTAELSAEVKAVYDADYMIAAQSNLYFDQLCDLRQVDEGRRGITYTWPLLENTLPNTDPLNEKTDVVGQTLSADEISVTLQEFGGAIEVTRFLAAVAYVDIYEQAAYANGYNLAESLDLIARRVFGQGSRRFFPAGVSARSSIAGRSNPAHRLSPGLIELWMVFARASRMPLFEDNTLTSVMHPFVWYDLMQATDIRNLAQFQHPELLFNGEIAKYGALRLVLSGNAKGFYGAGAAPATAVATTLAAAISRGDSNIKVTANTNIAVGDWLNIVDTVETGNTWYDTNELVYVLAVGTGGAGGTGIDVFAYDPGPGDAGGCRYAHVSGKAVTNNNTVYPVVMVGPKSVTKGYSSFTGPYGESVVTGPFDKLGRFLNFGWYMIGGYARTRSPWVPRGELGSSIA